MSERNYYVLCDDNCRFPGMTAEQIIAAIEDATGNVPQSVDDAFITQIKEQNVNANIKLWVGTSAQYNALANKSSDTVYIVSDQNVAEIHDTKELEEAISGKAEVNHTHELADIIGLRLNAINGVTISPNNPTGGQNGDFWFRYEG